MKALFLGVGEACDPACFNTSVLIESESKAITYYTLLDCGFTTPHRYFEKCSDPEQLDALWISHFHGDHFFGVPLLLLRFWEMGRSKELVILGPHGVKEKVDAALTLAFPGFGSRLQYPIIFHEMTPGVFREAAGSRWSVAKGDHSQSALALRFDGEDRSFFYSGDGRPTPETAALAKGCDLIIHESYSVSQDIPGHGSVQGSLAFADAAGARYLALIHVSHFERSAAKNAIKNIVVTDKGVRVVMPEPGEVLVF